jgi:hypothetical protein
MIAEESLAMLYELGSTVIMVAAMTFPTNPGGNVMVVDLYSLSPTTKGVSASILVSADRTLFTNI